MKTTLRDLIIAGIGALISALFLAPPAFSAPILLDFETEDDPPGSGTPLGNGQIIDTEFGNLVSISSPETGVNHLGPTIFDSTPCPGGPNCGSSDPDLLVDLGNVLILQSTNHPANNGSFFFTPDDMANSTGTLVFDFVAPFELFSIDLIDINGGVFLDLTLTDANGRTRVYEVPEMWTYDINAHPAGDGYDTLDLQTLLDQVGEAGSIATVQEPVNPLYDPTAVVKLEVYFHGPSPSSAVDNLVIPEPSTLALLLVGTFALCRRRG